MASVTSLNTLAGDQVIGLAKILHKTFSLQPREK